MNIATLFSLYAVITRLAAGPSAFGTYHMTVVTLVAIYVGGALVGGTLVGLMRPMTTNPFGAAFVGFIAALPIVAVLVKFLDDDSGWSNIDNFGVVVCSVAYGSLMALIWLRRSMKAREKSAARERDSK